MRLGILLLLGLCCLEAAATGIGPPAGMGTLLLMMAAGAVLSLLLVSWVLYKLYKHSTNKKRFMLVLTVTVLLMVFVWSVGLRIDNYDFIDNNPLESPMQIVENKDGHYFQLSDGKWYKFTDKYHRGGGLTVKARLLPGRPIMLEPNSAGNQYTAYTVGDTHAYYWHQREQATHALSVPLKLIKQDKYEKKFEGKLEQLNPNWQAAEIDLIRALTKDDCCDVPWLEELLERGANRNDVINKEQLLHRFFDHTDRPYRLQHRHVVVPMLLDAGANINAIQRYSGSSVLHKVIRKMPAYKKAGLEAADEKFLRLLLDRGADPNISYYNGTSPLEGAVRSQQYEVAMLLLEYGADPHLRVDDYGTAYQLAQSELQRQQKRSVAPDLLLVDLMAMMDSGS